MFLGYVPSALILTHTLKTISFQEWDSGEGQLRVQLGNPHPLPVDQGRPLREEAPEGGLLPRPRGREVSQITPSK